MPCQVNFGRVQAMWYSLVSDQDSPLTTFDQRDQRTWLRDLRSLVNENCIEVDVAKDPKSSPRARREDDACLLHPLDRLLYKSRVVCDAAAEARVDGELLERLVDPGAFCRSPDDPFLVEQVVGTVVCCEPFQDVVDGCNNRVEWDQTLERRGMTYRCELMRS